MGDDVAGGKIALKVLKYIGLAPTILLFAILLTVLPLISSIDGAMSENISPEVISIALDESTQNYTDVFQTIRENCETETNLTFDTYVVPCSEVGAEDSWDSIANYLTTAYPRTYYELVPSEELGFNVSDTIDNVGRPVLFVLIVLSVIMMVVFAKAGLSSSLNYLSVGFLLAGIVYIILITVLLNIVGAAELPEFVKVLIPNFFPPRFIGFVYFGVSAVIKSVELIFSKTRR